MGSVIEAQKNHTLNIYLRVEDPTEPDSRYMVDLIYSDIEQQYRNSLEKCAAADGLTESWTFEGDSKLLFDQYAASGAQEFFCVRVRRGDDDRTWSAPIRINYPRPYDIHRS